MSSHCRKGDFVSLFITTFTTSIAVRDGVELPCSLKNMVLWVFVLTLAFVHSKVLKSSVELDKDLNWQYLTKFGMDIGTGHWNVRLKLARGPKNYNGKKYPLDFAIFIDDDWEAGLYQVNCHRMKNDAKRSKKIEIPADGTWSDEVEGGLTQTTRPRMWYFTLSDCNSTLGEYAKIRYELTITNSDESHFSIEQQGMAPILLCLTAGFLFLLGNNVFRLCRYYTQNEELEVSLLLLNFSACCTLSSLVFNLIDLWTFAGNGKGIGAFSFLQELSEMTSQILIAFLLIGLAEGYTIKTKEFPSPETYIPVFLMVAMAYVVVIGLGMLAEDAHYRYTKYEDWAGWGLIFLRLCLLAWFQFNIKTTFTGKESLQVTEFIGKLNHVGSAYFLALPVIVFGSCFFAGYLRMKITFGCCMLTDIVAQVVLTLLFTRRGKYHKISTYSDSVLPGGKLHY